MFRENLIKGKVALFLVIAGVFGFLFMAKGQAIAALPSDCPLDMSHYWQLEEGASPYTDFYGGNGATCTNCPTATTGIIGGAQQFTLTSEVTVPADGTFNWGVTDNFSIEFWMKTDAASTCSGNQVIVGIKGSLSGLMWVGCVDGGTADFELYDKYGNGASAVGIKHLSDGNWHHVVAVRDAGANQLLIYVDGNLEMSEPAYYSSDGFDLSTALDIGWMNMQGGHHFVGSIDEIALYNRALTAREVMSNYLAEVNGNPWTSMAELNVPGTTVGVNQSPGGTLNTPSQNTTITALSDVSGPLLPDWTSVTQSPFPLSTPVGITNPVLTAADVTDIPAEFVADPFLFYEGSTWFLFFEVYSNYGYSDYGRIGVAESTDGLHWQYDRIVLDEGVHHSYPQVFKYNNHYYMVPESYLFDEVRLYEASNFPYGWSYAATLASGRAFTDPSIFRYNNTWWMFVSDTDNANCYLYYSDDLISGWVEHPKSPIVNGDKSKARPGGRSFVFDNDRIIRIAQKDDIVYGEAVRAFQVDTLTKTDYAEHEITESPILAADGSGWNSSGMHQFDPWWTGYQWLCSADGWDAGNDWSIGIFAVGSSCIYGPVWLGGMDYQTSIQAAYESLTQDKTLMIVEGEMPGDLDFSKNSYLVTLAGGYDCGFGSIIGTTTIKGTVVISTGTVVLDSISIQ